MSQPRRIAWVVPPPEICCICREPLGVPEETSAWNGRPAHRDCVRIQLIQGDPAFRETGEVEDPPDEGADSMDGVLPRDDEDSTFE